MPRYNPLRPDKGRTMQCVYWTFLELPDYVLQHVDGWFLFGALRSTVADEYGGISKLIKHILLLFFVEGPQNFSTGVFMFAGQDQILCRAKFGGLLCDEKASKEVLSLKGASGTKPCSTCKNVARGVNVSLLADNYLIGIECADYGRMDFHTNESFWQMIDLISAAKPAMNKKQFEAL